VAWATVRASAARQIQHSAGGGYRMLKRFNKPLKRSFSGRFSRLGIAQVNLALHSAYRKRFNTPSVIHPSLAENLV
jgi:hypothetical protein